MNKISFYLTIFMLALFAGACKSQQGKIKLDNNNTTEWAGVYYGTTPCADCPGINVELTLLPDLTYNMTLVYQDRQGTFIYSGSFAWNEDGTKISLENINEGEGFKYFSLKENKLSLLTPFGEIDTHLSKYTLSKVDKAAAETGLTNKYWKLVEINGTPVNYPESAPREAYISFTSDGAIYGCLGCNTFTGSYTLQDGSHIRFSQMVNTQKMCINMDIETEMLRVLQITDNYNINEKQLVFNRARMAPLARFEVIYMN